MVILLRKVKIMKKNPKKLFLILFTAAAISLLVINFSGCFRSGSSASSLSGDIMETHDFTLNDLDGNTVTLSGYKGKIIVINFWATWCPPCKAEIPDFIEVNNEYEGKNVQFLGISAENIETVRGFAKDYKINYVLLIDPGGTVFRKWNVSAIPHTFIIDAEGKVALSQVGLLNKNQLKNAIEKIKG